MNQSTLPLFEEPFTTADLDEWIAHVETEVEPSTSHRPNQWARRGLAEILGEEVPDRSWLTAELLALLKRARH